MSRENREKNQTLRQRIKFETQYLRAHTHTYVYTRISLVRKIGHYPVSMLITSRQSDIASDVCKLSLTLTVMMRSLLFSHEIRRLYKLQSHVVSRRFFVFVKIRSRVRSLDSIRFRSRRFAGLDSQRVPLRVTVYQL